MFLVKDGSRSTVEAQPNQTLAKQPQKHSEEVGCWKLSEFMLQQWVADAEWKWNSMPPTMLERGQGHQLIIFISFLFNISKLGSCSDFCQESHFSTHETLRQSFQTFILANQIFTMTTSMVYFACLTRWIKWMTFRRTYQQISLTQSSKYCPIKVSVRLIFESNLKQPITCN